MAKKCLPIKGVFKKNETHPDIWDLTDTTSKMPFSYFRATEPREMYLMQQGAIKVLESHKDGVKVLHTGLRLTTVHNVYSGNLFNPETNKRRLLLAKFNPADDTLTIYLYRNNPKRIKDKIIEVKND